MISHSVLLLRDTGQACLYPYIPRDVSGAPEQTLGDCRCHVAVFRPSQTPQHRLSATLFITLLISVAAPRGHRRPSLVPPEAGVCQARKPNSRLQGTHPRGPVCRRCGRKTLENGQSQGKHRMLSGDWTLGSRPLVTALVKQYPKWWYFRIGAREYLPPILHL